MTNFNENQSLVLYIISFFISVMIATLYQKSLCNELKQNQVKNITLFILVISLPVFLASVRYGTGTDYFNYVYSFYIFSEFSFLNILFGNSDPLFGVLYFLTDKLFNDVWGLFFLSSLLTIVILVKTLEHYKSVISISFALFIFYFQYYGLTYNIVRQMIAITLVFYCYKFILEKKSVKYIIGILIASQFHFSALFMLPLYFLSKTNKYKNAFLYLIIIFSPPLVYVIINILIKLEFSRFTTTYSYDFSSGGIGFLVWILPVLLPIYIYRKRVLSLNPKLAPLFIILLLQIPFLYLGYFSLHAYRMAYYSSIVEIVLVPLVIKSISNKNERIILISYFVVWYLFRFIFDYYINGGGEIFPYKSIL